METIPSYTTNTSSKDNKTAGRTYEVFQSAQQVRDSCHEFRLYRFLDTSLEPRADAHAHSRHNISLLFLTVNYYSAVLLPLDE